VPEHVGVAMLNPNRFHLLNPDANTGVVESLIYNFAGKEFTTRDVKVLAEATSRRLTRIGTRQLHDTIHAVLRTLVAEGRVVVVDYRVNRNVYRCDFIPCEKLPLLKEFMANHRSNGEITATEEEFLEFLGAYVSARDEQS